MKVLSITLGSFMLLALAGCSSTRVLTDYNRGASFTHLKTYTWIDRPVDAGGKRAFDSPLLDQHIRVAVDNALARMGYQKVTSGMADFRIAHHVVTGEKVDVSPTYTYYDYAPYGRHSYRRHHYGYRGYRGHGRLGYRHHGGYGHHRGRSHLGFGYSSGGYAHEYLEGTLILDIIDAHSNEIIWRGWASKALDQDPDPKNVRMYVNKAVEKILEKFPPA